MFSFDSFTWIEHVPDKSSLVSHDKQALDHKHNQQRKSVDSHNFWGNVNKEKKKQNKTKQQSKMKYVKYEREKLQIDWYRKVDE